MKKLIFITLSLFYSFGIYAQDLYSGGSNSWIFHTPDDGRTSLLVAPYTNGAYDWSKKFEFYNNGGFKMHGNLSLGNIYGSSSGDLTISSYDNGSGSGFGLKFNAVENGINFQTFAGSWGSRLFIADLGNVGIGVINPKTNLDISGNIGLGERLNNTTNYIGRYINGVFGSNSNWIGFNSTTTEDFITFATHKSGASGGERMRIDAIGYVGIGTTNPKDKLQIGSGFAFHDGGHKVLGFGYAAGGTDLDINGYAAEIRLDPASGNFRFGTSASKTAYSTTRMTINKDGNVGIGTTSPPTGYKLAVAGKIITEEVKVKLQSAWPDYVFSKNYKLSTLEATETFIQNEGHLPNIPSAAEVAENGIELGALNAKLLEKIEELTLHLIALKKENVIFQKRLEKLESN